MNHIYIDTDHALSQLVTELQKTDRVALDTEADSLHNYKPKVCLMQLATEGKNVIVDPLSDINLTPLLDILKDKLLIIHGADYDLRMMNDSFSFRPRAGIFDTMVAARILGFKEIGLTALIKKYFNISLSKQKQKSDWSRRPLTPEQIAYAVADVHYLEHIADQLSTALEERGRMEWHRESCAHLVTITGTGMAGDEEREPWRIKGSGTLGRKQLAYVQALWQWREHEAERADVPPFKVMANKQLIQLACWIATHPHTRFEKSMLFPKNMRERRLAHLKEAVARVRNVSPSSWPEKRRLRRERLPKPMRMKDLIAACAKRAHELGIEPSVLATRASLEALARYRPKTIDDIISQGNLMRWQAELIQPIISDIFGN